MDFDQLTTFLEVARLGNFSRAGEKVFRSQSAVSVQIRQLEQDYGTRLLDRTGKRVQLTPAGEVLFDYAVKLIALRNESLQVVSGPEETPRGTLSIGANEATCLYVLPDVFTAYRSLNPHVQISIYRSFSHKVIQKLHEGAVDVGVVTMPVKDSRLVAQRIFHDPLTLIVTATIRSQTEFRHHRRGGSISNTAPQDWSDAHGNGQAISPISIPSPNCDGIT